MYYIFVDWGISYIDTTRLLPQVVVILYITQAKYHNHYNKGHKFQTCKITFLTTHLTLYLVYSWLAMSSSWLIKLN